MPTARPRRSRASMRSPPSHRRGTLPPPPRSRERGHPGARAIRRLLCRGRRRRERCASTSEDSEEIDHPTGASYGNAGGSATACAACCARSEPLPDARAARDAGRLARACPALGRRERERRPSLRRGRLGASGELFVAEVGLGRTLQSRPRSSPPTASVTRSCVCTSATPNRFPRARSAYAPQRRPIRSRLLRSLPNSTPGPG